MGRTTDEWAALLDYTTPEPWFANGIGFGRIENIGPISTGFSIGDGLDCDEHDAELAAAAPEAVAEVVRLRRVIDADILEYRVEHQHIDNGMWHPVTGWSPEWPLKDGHSVASNERIVCRRVSAPWEVKE